MGRSCLPFVIILGHVCLSQVARCLTLIEMNLAAARRFYQMVISHLPPATVVRFILALYETITHCVEEGEGGGEGETNKTR